MRPAKRKAGRLPLTWLKMIENDITLTINITLDDESSVIKLQELASDREI